MMGQFVKDFALVGGLLLLALVTLYTAITL